MSWEPTEVPEPFRYSRAHSYPSRGAGYGGVSGQDPDGRGRLLIAALVGFVLVGLLGAAMFLFFLRPDARTTAQPPPDPCAETVQPAPAGMRPEISDVVPPPEVLVSEPLEAESAVRGR